MKYNSEALQYGGQFNKYFWDPKVNPNASVVNGLSNCTTLTYGLCLLRGLGAPVTRIGDGGNWHNLLSSDWECYAYRKEDVKKNDILEWDGHVALVDDIEMGEPYVHCSWYTGQHGVSRYDGKWDTRPYSSMKELSDAMQEWPYRFYHYVSVTKENSGVRGEPKYILRKKGSSGDVKEKLDEIIRLIEEIKEEI